MHQAFVKIIIDRIRSQFITEQSFYQNYLGIDETQWYGWKTGESNLTGEDSQKIKNLFTDYEWMLIQKLIRQATLFPEKRNYVVSEYKRVKAQIAKTWIDAEMANVELISQKNNHTDQKNNSNMVHLRVSLDYVAWGFDDILLFHLPAIIQQQIENSPVDLLEWVSENLTDSYLETNTED